MSDYRDMTTGEELTEWELKERYDDALDDCYGDVEIGGLMYRHSRAMKAVDPIAYRCSFIDWVDSELGASIEEIENG